LGVLYRYFIFGVIAMKKLSELLQRKNLVVIVPAIVSLVATIAGVYGVTIDAENLTNEILVAAGLIGTVIGIFANSDKKEK
jgi:uncharacterized membrane protein